MPTAIISLTVDEGVYICEVKPHIRCTFVAYPDTSCEKGIAKIKVPRTRSDRIPWKTFRSPSIYEKTVKVSIPVPCKLAMIVV
jgi:hypothetical protein